MSENDAIAFKDVSRRFGPIRALEGVSFRIPPGEFVGLIGHNGAGKSTAIRILTGQIPPSSGAVRVRGVEVSEDPAAARRLLGYTPENPILYEYLTAREFLEFVASVRGGADVEEPLALAGLGEDADRLIREYSQGMRRRTALAAALVGRPPVFVLDEALNGLDPPSAARVRSTLAARCAEGHTVLLSTHVLETVERVADRVIMLAHGRVVADERVAHVGRDGLERLFLERLAHEADSGERASTD